MILYKRFYNNAIFLQALQLAAGISKCRYIIFSVIY